MKTSRSIAALPFALTTPAGLDLWPPAEAGAGHRDLNESGRTRACALIKYMRDNQAPMALGHVIAAMIITGTYGPMEVSFANTIACLAIEPDSVEYSPGVVPQLSVERAGLN